MKRTLIEKIAELFFIVYLDGMRDGLWSERSGFDSHSGRRVEQDTFTSQKVLVIPRKRSLSPDMTEELFTGTFSQNETNI